MNKSLLVNLKFAREDGNTISTFASSLIEKNKSSEREREEKRI